MIGAQLTLMLRNGFTGFVLVFLLLALFLDLQLAFWVSLGIPISFLGAIMLMPWLDVTVNILYMDGVYPVVYGWCLPGCIWMVFTRLYMDGVCPVVYGWCLPGCIWMVFARLYMDGVCPVVYGWCLPGCIWMVFARLYMDGVCPVD